MKRFLFNLLMFLLIVAGLIGIILVLRSQTENTQMDVYSLGIEVVSTFLAVLAAGFITISVNNYNNDKNKIIQLNLVKIDGLERMAAELTTKEHNFEYFRGNISNKDEVHNYIDLCINLEIFLVTLESQYDYCMTKFYVAPIESNLFYEDIRGYSSKELKDYLLRCASYITDLYMYEGFIVSELKRIYMSEIESNKRRKISSIDAALSKKFGKDKEKLEKMCKMKEKE